MLIGIYGGSFDPPHYGHVLLAEHVLGERLVDRILVVPVFVHPFHKDMAPFDERLELCRRAFAQLAGVEISSIERGLPIPNFTVQTLQAIQRTWPDASLRLIVGSDVLDSIERWHRIDEVRRLAPLLVVGRAGYERPDAPAPVLPDVSSSEVRRALLRRAEPGASQQWRTWLPPPVIDRIEERALYS